MANRWVTLNLTTTDKITELYVATLDRAPDKGGLAYWVNEVTSGKQTIAQVAASFYSQPEVQAKYPAGTTNESFVIAVYNNAFGRAPDTAGLNFWVGELNAGRVTRPDFILQFLQGAYDDPAATPPSFDSSLLTNQHIAAEYFAGVDSTGATVNPDAKDYPWTGTPAEQANFLANATAVMAPVTANASTIALSKALSDAFETGGGVVGSGQTFTLTTTVDNIPGLIGSKGTTDNTGDDTIIAGEGSVGGQHTLGSSDVINGGTGVDRINIRLADVAPPVAVGQTITPNMTSVEKVFTQAINSVVAGSNAINAINVTGTTEWWSDNSTATLIVNNVNEKAAVGVIGGDVEAAEVDDYLVGFKSSAVTGALTVVLQGVNLDDLGVSAQDGVAEFATWDISVTGTANSAIDTLTDNLQNPVASLTTINVSGDKQLTIDDVLTGVTTFNASKQTAGGLRVVVDTTKDIAFTGGAGADRVDVGALGLNLNDKLDGGTGTDTFRISDGVMLTTALAGNVKGFEIFEGRGIGQVYDLDALLPNNTLTEVRLNPTSGVANNITVNNIPSTATTTIRAVADETGTATLTAKDFIQGGTTDTATLILDNSVTKAATGVDIATLDFARVDNLKIESKSDGTPALGEENSIGALTAGDLEVITITGDNGIVLTTTATSNAVTKVDASGLASATTGLTLLTVNLSADTAGEGAEIIGTAQKDVITSTAVNILGKGDNITAGAGSDTITLSTTVLARNNTINYTAATIGTGDLAADTQDVITGIAVGDRINMTAGVEGQLKVNGLLLSATAADQTLTAAAFDINNNIIAINKGTDRAIQIDLNNDGLFTSTLDYEILLTGAAGSTVQYNATNDWLAITALAPVAGLALALTASATDNLVGGAGNDTITGAASANLVATDTVTGGLGTDGLVVTGNATATTDANLTGVETITWTGAGAANKLDLTGQTEAFAITGTLAAAGAESLTAGNGNDTITLTSAMDLWNAGVLDVIDGGAGNDTVQTGFNLSATTAGGDPGLVNVENISLTAGVVLDLSTQTEAFNIIGFTTGASTITGGTGADTITGGTGADSVVLSVGNDSITLGEGSDTVSAATGILTTTTVINGGNGADVLTLGGVGAANTDANLTGVETITLITSAGNLSLAGQTEAFTVNLSTGGVNDTVTGGEGGDTFVQGTVVLAVTDSINGGGGTDTLRLEAAGTHTLSTDANLVSVENIVFTATGNTLVLSTQTEAFNITGFATGATTVTGGAAADTVTLGTGADRIISGGSLYGAGLSVIDTIVNFNTAGDDSFKTGVLATSLNNLTIATADAATLAAAISTAATAAGAALAANTQAYVITVQAGAAAGVYAFQNIGGTLGTVDATDFMVKLTGTPGTVLAADFIV